MSPGCSSSWELRSLRWQIHCKEAKRTGLPQLRPTCPNLFVLQDHTVVDKANVLRGVVGLGPLLAQQVQDAGGQHSELAVLDELAQV